MASEGAVIRIRCVDSGEPLEEEFFGVKLTRDVPNYGPMGVITQTNWGFIRLFSFRARRGELDALARSAPTTTPG